MPQINKNCKCQKSIAVSIDEIYAAHECAIHLLVAHSCAKSKYPNMRIVMKM